MFSGRDSAKSCVVVLGSGNRELTTEYVVTELVQVCDSSLRV